MKVKEQIIVVEDDEQLNKGLCRALKTEDRKLISCTDLQGAREQMCFGCADLVLLDIKLPDGNGIDLLEEIKEKCPKSSVVILTANDTDADIVSGLERGADDYITKPFSLSVLRARVNTQLRKKREEEKSGIRIDHFSFDFFGQRFTVHDLPVELSKTEQRLLYILISNRGRILTRERMIEYVWNRADLTDENSLSVAVKRLRDKLDAGPYIQTVYGVGYRWVKK